MTDTVSVGLATPAPAAAPRARRGSLLLAPLACAGVAIGSTAALVAWNPHTHHVPLCPFHAVTGLWCPLCGGLRAVHDVATGHLVQALSDNVLVLVALPFVVFWWYRWLGRAHAGLPGAPQRIAGHRLTVWVLVLAVVAFTVLRNLPIGHLLAP